eukprot:gene10177-11261_t
MNNTELLEESPNGYEITTGAPKESEQAVRHYLDLLERFNRIEYPVEYALANYALARQLFADMSRTSSDEEKAKIIENALFYFNQALELFDHRNYPMMHALICIFMGRLFRERSLLISPRSFLAQRSTPADSLQFGIDQALEALPLYAANKAYRIEHALCCLELGQLIVLQLDLPAFCENATLREEALGYLERAASLVTEAPETITYKRDNGLVVRWRPADEKSYPQHVQMLMDGLPLDFLPGRVAFLLGRLEEGWSFHVDDDSEREVHIARAFEQFTFGSRPRYQNSRSTDWTLAHHRLALLVLKNPRLIDADYEVDERGVPLSDLPLQAALSHLVQALRHASPGLTRAQRMDLHFHAAQTYISLLQVVIDRVPYGESVTKAIVQAEAVDLISSAVQQLLEARKRVTAANTQSVQDAYVYYYSSLKLAEYRMLQAACGESLEEQEREACLEDSVRYLVDACLARPLADNLDLHYLGGAQMAQMVAALQRPHATSKAYAKVLMSHAALTNRSLFCPVTTQTSGMLEEKLRKDLRRHLSQAALAAVRGAGRVWTKLHLGGTVLQERPAAGYASWAFEDLPAAHRMEEREHSFSWSLEGQQPAEGSHVVPRASPPRTVPPLLLPSTMSSNGQPKSLKKVYVSGEDIPENLLAPSASNSNNNHPTTESFPPPEGPVPLHALGHIPTPSALLRQGSEEEGRIVASGEARRLPQSPYVGRMRYRVPPLAQMREIDKANRVAFGMSRGQVVSLLPAAHGSHTVVVDRRGDKRDDGQDLSSKPNRSAASTKDSGQARVGLERVKEENNSDDGSIPSKTDEQNPPPIQNHEDLHREGRTANEEVESNGDGDDDDEEEEEEEEGDVNEQDGSLVGSRGSKSIGSKLLGAMTTSWQGGRPRSKRIRGSPPPASSDLEAKPNSLTRPWNWLVGRGMRTYPEGGASGKEAPSRKKLLSFLPSLTSRGKGKDGSNKMGKKSSLPKVAGTGGISEASGFWVSSPRAFFLLLLLSRGARSELVLRGRSLQVLSGERVAAILYRLKAKHRATFCTLVRSLRVTCRQAVADLLPSQSVLELARLSTPELHQLFRSQAQVAAKLDALEHLLAFKISKYDFFLPLIGCGPTLSTPLQALDESLLQADTLLANLALEKQYALIHEGEKQGKRGQERGRVETLQDGGRGGKWHDSVSSQAPSLSSASSSHVRVFAPNRGRKAKEGMIAEEAQQAEEEEEEVLTGRMTFSLSQLLDGCGYYFHAQQGLKDMALQNLGQEECLWLWHLPSVPGHPLLLILLWREDSHSLHAHFSSQQAREARLSAEREKQKKKRSKPEKGSEEEKLRQHFRSKGLVVEMAKSDLDASHTLQYVRRYLDALHSQPFSRKAALVDDALRALSCALAVTELLLLMPATVRSLIICAPPFLRLVPWHLLLFEDSVTPSSSTVAPSSSPAVSQQPVLVRHLAEVFLIRLGPSLTLFEMSMAQSRSIRQVAGLHRLCALDGEDRRRSLHSEATMHPRSGAALGGVRGPGLEAACVANTFSADPLDSHVLADAAAEKDLLQTAILGEERIDDYRRFKQSLRRFLDGEEEEQQEEDAQQLEEDRRLQRLRSLAWGDMEPLPEQGPRGKQQRRKEKNRKNRGRNFKKEEEEEEDSELSGEDGEESEEEEKEEEDEAFRDALGHVMEEHRENVIALTACRVLHVAAFKQPHLAALLLPGGSISAREWVRRIFIKNCTLAVLSRYGLCDDVRADSSSQSQERLATEEAEAEEAEAERSWEMVEALIISGAASVLVPLWEGSGQGPISLAQLLFLVRFYAILPSRSRARLPISEAVRATQLWLKDCSADDAIAFLAKAPIPASAREVIIAEVEAQVAASRPPDSSGKFPSSSSSVSSVSRTEASDRQHGTVAFEDTAGNRVGGQRKLFSHFLCWGSFIVCGAGGAAGGGVHHPDLTEEHEDAEGGALGDGLWSDAELNNIVFEISVLRMEGRLQEAKELEHHLLLLRIQRMKERYDRVKETGWKAGRAFMDGLDYLDKTFLEQDSDSVSSVSSDDDKEEEEEDEGGSIRSKTRKKSQRSKRNKKSKGGDEANVSAKSSSLPVDQQAQQQQVLQEEEEEPLSKKHLFRPLDLDTRNQQVQYEEWRSKVGGLAPVKAPVIQVRRKPKGRSAPSPTKPDNYEFGMLKAMLPEAVEQEEEDSGNSSAGEQDEQRKRASKKQKQRAHDRDFWSEIFGGVRSYGEIARMLADQAASSLPAEPPQLSQQPKTSDECCLS